MNLDNKENIPANKPKAAKEKKLSRKEKKALKNAKADTPVETPKPKTNPAPNPVAKKPERKTEEVEAKLDLSPVHPVPPPKYTAWEKISPPARRKKQINNMESGFREVLGLVQSMRNNQEVLLDAFKKLPEAVDSVKKLADHSAQQSDLLKAMNEQMGSGAAGEFNKTLSSMDQTTQLLLERAQRSEEKLYSMLRRAQRRIAFMTLLVLMLFVGAVAAVVYVAFPEKAQPVLNKLGLGEKPVIENTVTPIPTPEEAVLPPALPKEEVIIITEEIIETSEPVISEAIMIDSLPLAEMEIAAPSDEETPTTDSVDPIISPEIPTETTTEIPETVEVLAPAAEDE